MGTKVKRMIFMISMKRVNVCAPEKDLLSLSLQAGTLLPKKTGGKPCFPPARTQKKLLVRSHGLDDLDLTAIVGTALRAHSVRQMQRTALGACHQTGSRQLPHGAASLIASLLGYFSLRYCHVDTSLVLYCLSSEFIEEFTLPPEAGAWPEPPGGDPPVFCSGKSLG